MIGADDGIVGLALQGFADRDSTLSGLLPSVCCRQIDEVKLVARLESGEVDDDVVAFGDALLVEFRQSQRVDDEVAVVGDEREGHLLALANCRSPA